MKYSIHKQRRQHAFTVIELVLAIAVILVGITSVLVLMTAGLMSSQSAIGNTRAADAAQTMISSIKTLAMKSDVSGNWNNFLKQFPSRRGDDDECISGEDTNPDAKIWKDPELERKIYNEEDTFIPVPMPGEDYYFYRILSKTRREDPDNADEYIYSIDFDAIVRIWTMDSIKKYIDEDLNPPFEKWGRDIVSFGMEISWPTEAPYRSRQKKVYYFEYQRRLK